MHLTPVRDLMQHPVVTIHPEATVADAAHLMEDLNIRRLPVLDEEDRLVGIVTDADVLEAETAHSVLSTYERSTEDGWLTVAEIMSHEVITVGVDAKVGQLALIFMEHKISGVPVIDKATTEAGHPQVVGIVTETDIFRLIADAWSADQML